MGSITEFESWLRLIQGTESNYFWTLQIKFEKKQKAAFPGILKKILSYQSVNIIWPTYSPINSGEYPV